MNDLTNLAVHADYQNYYEGANAMRRYIMGETDVNPEAPECFRPLGMRWYPTNYADTNQT